MRRYPIGLVALLVLAIVSPASAATKPVTITKAGFVPADITVAVGDVVTWTNSDTVVHQVAFDKLACNLTIQPAQQGSCTFGESGTFNYRDPSQKGNFRGTVQVTAPAVTLSLAASRSIAVYGSGVTLSGKLSSGAAGEPVAVLAQPFGQTAQQQVGSTVTSTGGAWSLVVKPTVQTVYQARSRSVSSGSVTVRVRPRVTLSRVGLTFSTRVSAARSLAGRYVFFQRRTALGQWVSLKRVTLRATSAQTVAAASFRFTLPRGTSGVRILLPQAQAGGGYLAGISPVRTVVR